MKKPTLVYVSGPISTGNVQHNCRAGIMAARIIMERGYVVISPFESILSDMVEPWPYEKWLEYDFRAILCCDAVYRIPGVSPGADKEEAFAYSQRIPVYHSLDTLFACTDPDGPR